MDISQVPFNLEELCKICHVQDAANFRSQCLKLLEMLLKTNSHTNLTRITRPADFWTKHVADSLLISAHFPELSNTELDIVDVGCGAGFPSVILSIAFPNLHITAIDSIGKKTAFVAAAAQALNLHNLTVVTGRSRELNRQQEWHKRFDIITARAVSDLRTLYREAKNFARQDGRFIYYKTPEQAEAEIPQVTAVSRKNGLNWGKTEIFTLPETNDKRLFVYSKFTS